MPDYGHEIEFGYFLSPDAGDPQGLLQTARLADQLGYDLLAVQDHPYQRRHLDTLALLGVILARTERIRVFQDVGNLPLRPPAVFAKAAATLDLLSGGRFEAGLGGGGFLDAARAMGAPALTPGESLEALEEAVAILRASWNGDRGLRFDGRHYQLDGARPGPKPAHPIAIWLGAAKPRALALTGRVADGWAAPLMNYMPPAAAAEAQAVIDRAAREAGRDPSEIRRIYNAPGAFTETAPAPARDTDEAIVGPPDHWAEVLTHFALDLGFGTFLLMSPPDPDALRTFIEDVAPQVRERVAAARAHASSGPTPPPKVTSFEAKPETARGRAMYEMLLAVHAAIRRDLDLIQGLATQALDGVDAEDLRRQLHALKRGSMLWRLQVNCLRYCSFVHSHHNAEDANFFSELRDTNPDINPIIDRLQAEHRRVSDDLDAVEAAANGLADDDGQQARKVVVDALQTLRENLLAHLEYEELNIEATVRRVRQLP
jgi:alkanesulfonate monooxygenase SsuD/methylene tetrahydromethanopterin reductase-like flavin-dependent oxidoreductase (luciferase family)